MNHPRTGSGPVIPLNQNQQQPNHTIVPIAPPPMPPLPNLPRLDLLQGSRRDYIKVGVPLYEAAIKGDWKAAKPILDKQPDLIRFAVTENYDTPLHIAVSAESSKSVEEFVINLVNLMGEKDLELQNKNNDTALNLAAAAGNVRIASIMVKKNHALIQIPGNKRGMPLYMAALNAKADMVRYLYDISLKMTDNCWEHDTRGWVLQKCVEGDIFDVALKIVNDRPELIVKKELLTDVLLALAKKTYAFKGKKPNVIFRVIKSIFAVFHVRVGPSEKLLWFKEVEQMMPPQHRQKKNKEWQTPQDLFTKKHADLVIKGEEWMKDTSSQCLVAATLIATIVFASAFTLPGGYNQNTGIPYFHKEPSLIIFVISDAVSLISSSTSVLIFLSILTSRYAERDFLESLPKKLVNGLATLFLSIVTMMVAFSASFFVLYDKKLVWVPIVVTGLAGIPVILYVMLQYRLFKDVFKSAYRSRYLFKRNKHILYH
ncbi:hypothetical protein L1987_52275 [Smallanthus sonchifolius]|uniref:Uncharacterized protein n=1 Tax=Smallanthus sonchifolius TaxID=185202 RepID=A0ACB9ETD7_9ASTR|nr:hypothetical protein L1987_52275 [Smallanthus sonchifolius]